MPLEGADQSSEVRAYYEKNTRLFLALGIGRQTLAIRRAVWAEGVESLEDAVNYANSLVMAEAGRAEARQAEVRQAATKVDELRVLDIGCGVGGSLLYLARALHAPLRGVGVTISPRQAEIARRHARLNGLSARCSFIAADFAELTGLPPVHLAFAIESYVHFTTPATFFAAAARSIASGGRLMVIDDFLAKDYLAPKERRLVKALRYGWLLRSLFSATRAVQSGAECGMRLVEDRDLSGFLFPSALSPYVTRWALRVMKALPVPWQYWRSTVGSLALEACRQAGLVQYRVLVFEKPPA